MENIINFGKFKGQTIESIYENNNNYFNWTLTNMLSIEGTYFSQLVNFFKTKENSLENIINILNLVVSSSGYSLNKEIEYTKIKDYIGLKNGVIYTKKSILINNYFSSEKTKEMASKNFDIVIEFINTFITDNKSIDELFFEEVGIENAKNFFIEFKDGKRTRAREREDSSVSSVYMKYYKCNISSYEENLENINRLFSLI